MRHARLWSVRGLILLNAVLLAVLAAVVCSPGAVARPPAPERARGSYTMVGGKVIGSPEDAVYVVDAANQELVALKWERSRKSLKAIGYQSLAPARRTGGVGEPGR